MGQQLADQKLDEKMGIKNFRQFQQKHGPLMQEALGRPEGMAAITSLMERPDATLQGAANVKNVGPARRVVPNAPVLPPQMSGPEGAHTQIAPEHKAQDRIDALIATSLEQQDIIDQAQGTTPGL